MVKNLPANAGDQETWVQSLEPIPEFMPGKSYEQRRLVGYNPWGLKESDAIEHMRSSASPLPHILLASQPCTSTPQTLKTPLNLLLTRELCLNGNETD